MKRKIAFLLAMLMLICVCFTSCGEDTDDSKSEKETLEDLQEEIEDLKEELEDLKKEEETLKSEIGEVVVPKFVGKIYYTEVKKVEEYTQNFTFDIVWEEAKNPDTKNGEVFKQEPAAGKMVAKGTTITLYVNKDASDEAILEDSSVIEGAHKNDVRKLLQDAGFVVKEVVASSVTIPADHVISIDIEKGKPYPFGTEVTMVVSASRLSLPDLKGWEEERARLWLEQQGFVVEIRRMLTADYEEGLVSLTSPPAGFIVEAGETIVLCVSSKTPNNSDVNESDEVDIER